MNYIELKEQLKKMRTEVIDNPKLSAQEREDLKLAILLLIMHINHLIKDGT